MTITDEVVGGLFLIRAAIRSTNYNPGVAGWTINEDGTAQFFNIVLIGNDLKVLGSNGSQVEITTTSGGTQAEVLLSPPTQGGGITQQPGGAVAFGQTPGSPKPVLQLFSPIFNGNAQAAINLQGASADNALTPLINFLTTQLQLNGARAYLVTHEDNFDCTSLLTLAAAAAPILGCSASYSGLAAGAKWTATLFTDAGNGAAAGVNTIGELTVNANGAGAITQAGQAIWRAGAVINSGSMPSRSWSGSLPAGGALAFQATGRVVGGGVDVFATPNTTLQITIME